MNRFENSRSPRYCIASLYDRARPVEDLFTDRHRDVSAFENVFVECWWSRCAVHNFMTGGGKGAEAAGLLPSLPGQAPEGAILQRYG